MLMPVSTETVASEWRRPFGDEVGAAGLFGPDSMTWRIGRENALAAFGGARALILQVAHPLVAAGVGENSNYRQQPWDRLFRTLEAVTTIVFGTPEEAEAAARRVWTVHHKVRGELKSAEGSFPAGTAYDARDPALAMWVHATLFDTQILVYDRYVQRLSIAERETFYEEQKLFAEMFGVPRDRQPETYADFNAYFDDVVENELAVTDTLVDVVDATLVNPPLPAAARPLRRPAVEALKLQTAGALPPRLRAELGFGWGPRRERLMRASEPLVRNLLALAPKLVRDFPAARAAKRRVAAAA